MELDYFEMSFDGDLLRRGFWLYVWDVTDVERQTRVLYVGRTGDSSSANASSPFRRVGQHLDLKANAKGNSMAKQLQRAGIDPAECKFQMTAIGPIFEEQCDFESHKHYRDIIGAVESALAAHLQDRGYTVIGNHDLMEAPDQALWHDVQRLVNVRFPVMSGAHRPVSS
jgi:hypothetical protein